MEKNKNLDSSCLQDDPNGDRFDAVSESRKWKEAVSKELSAMSSQERLAYLRKTEKLYISNYLHQQKLKKQQKPESKRSR